METKDRRFELVQKIQLSKTKAILQPPIVFLCGGIVDIKQPEVLSVREALLEHMARAHPELEEQTTLAENYKDWLHDGVYADLLEFEDDIAHIASLIIVILESAGSIAELGAFAVNPHLNEKLLVVICEEHYEQDSFIKLGPLRRLDSLREGSVVSYPWNVNSPDPSIMPSLEHITDDINCFISDVKGSEGFNDSNPGHLAFLIYELVLNFKALKFGEIESYVKSLLPETSRDKIKKKLFLLQKFNFIFFKRRGGQEFYLPAKYEQRLKIAGFDKTTAVMSSMQYYVSNPKERRRLTLITDLASKPKKEGDAA